MCCHRRPPAGRTFIWEWCQWGMAGSDGGGAGLGGWVGRYGGWGTVPRRRRRTGADVSGPYPHWLVAGGLLATNLDESAQASGLLEADSPLDGQASALITSGEVVPYLLGVS